MNWKILRKICQTHRQRFVFTFVRRADLEDPKKSVVRNLFEHLGLTKGHFPALRVFRMNKHTFFGDKYKMDNELFTVGNIHGFLNLITTRNARVYKKAQNFKLVERYNFRKEKQIKRQLAMKLLHNENFLDTIDANQVNAGYLMFAYANAELCEKCEAYEHLIVNAFGKVSADRRPSRASRICSRTTCGAAGTPTRTRRWRPSRGYSSKCARD